MGLETVLFIAVGGLAVLFAIGMLLSENAVHSALFLIGNFGCIAFLFLMLDAPFISMVQIAVYAGAIMVLFLFVIMLLGAEKTTDTQRRFRWLTGTATVLSIAFLTMAAVPLVSTSYIEPEARGADPQVRVAHGAQTPAVNVEITGGELTEPILLKDLGFGDISEFATLPPGEYTFSVILAENGVAIYNTTAVLEPGQVITAAAYGEFSTAAQTFDLELIENDITPAGDDQARLTVFNGYIDDTLALVDLGPNRALDISVDGAITDRVFVDGLEYGEDPVVMEVREGTYNLVFVNTGRLDASEPESGIVAALRDYEIDQNTEQALILVPDGDQPVLDLQQRRARALTELTLDTLPTFGSPLGIGQILFTDYLLPVNLVGFLLLVALIGVIVLTRPEGEMRKERRTTRRRKVSRPLVSVISDQTRSDLTQETPRLDKPTSPEGSGD